MGARRDTDADSVRFEFLGAGKARHRQLGFGERKGGEIGIVAHVGDDAGDDGGLTRLVLADRRVFSQHMGHLVAQHRGQFRGIAGQRDQATRHVKLSGRKRERIHRARIEDRHLVGLVGTVRCRNQPVDRLADQGLQVRIVIGTAIGGQDPFVLALGGRGLRNCPGLERACGRDRGLKLGDIAAGGKRKGRAQQHRRSPKAAAHPGLVPSRAFCHVSHSYLSRELILAQQLNLSRAEHFDPRAAARLDPASDTNSSIFKRLNDDSGNLKRRCRAP